ncbi:rhodanese-like domain-containing protein [Aliiruegeria sabulilitoris]|uniref:rhodanese-like domain-containing protein n=1 Tax=Aliiruegeria sabulilitoris TaxID=1510458 RepID=UPI000829C351|nr:rhodanese-like domain-containing protein [Aliiruegeria sabulilitoris]
MSNLKTIGLSVLLSLPVAAYGLEQSVEPDQVPTKKQTTLGYYLTPSEAHDALEQTPEIVFIDVRDPKEATFVGLPDSVDAVVPLMTVADEFLPDKGKYAMTPNPAFLDQVAGIVEREGRGKDEILFVICQSGGRTAKAVNALAKAGYSKVYALFEGIEGDLNKETGHRDLNGWKNAGLPWGYTMTETQAWQPKE